MKPKIESEINKIDEFLGIMINKKREDRNYQYQEMDS